MRKRVGVVFVDLEAGVESRRGYGEDEWVVGEKGDDEYPPSALIQTSYIQTPPPPQPT